MSEEQDEGSYIEEEEEEEEEEDQFTSSEFQQDEAGRSMSYLRFNDPAGAGEEGLDSEPGEGQRRDEGTEMEELDDDEEELDSLAEASEDQVVRRALDILGLDPDGRVLPLSADQELLLHSLWAKSGAADLRPGLAPASAKPLDSSSALAPQWLRELRHSVLFSPPSDPQEEENLVNAIKKNLCSIVNNLSEDQWRHPPPPSFLPSTSCSSSRANPEGFEGATSSTHEHEAYLQREFNPLSLVSSLAADSMADSAQPPRQLWLGEDEDEGLDSEASLIDLLNASPALPESANQSHLSPTWPRPRRSNTRHAQSSSLARQVSRLGMGE